MERNRKKGGIPDRWLDYKTVGKRLFGTRFIAFKVPLKPALNSGLPRSEVFGPWELLDSIKKQQQELGLIIDLTYTTRYYNLQDLPDSLMFVKIFTAGHEVPSDKTILSFKRAVQRFLRDNSDNDKLIGVHCTHGLNRTGYLICRYLIDVDGWKAKEAVKLFNLARGHSIERKNYLEDLYCGQKRSNKGMEECEEEPVRGCAEPLKPKSRHLPPMTCAQDSGHLHRPQTGLFHTPLLPTPVYSRAIRAPNRKPYGQRPPWPGGHRKTPPNPEFSRSRYPSERGIPSHEQERRRRGPPHSHRLPRYSPAWNNTTNY